MPGKLVTIDIEGRALIGNALGDPITRRTPVWLPPGYDDAGLRWPVVFVLPAYSSHGRVMVAERTFAESFDRRVDRLVDQGTLAPAIFVLPDLWTRLGGSQYVDSTATGRYETYLLEDVLPAIDRAFRTDPLRRGICGKSSGGFGALRLAALRPDLFPVFASMSGDAYFEYCYMPDFADLMVALDACRGDPAQLLASIEKKIPLKLSKRDFLALNMIAMSACYSPDPTQPLGLALPIDWPTGRLRQDVWQRWKSRDPVEFLAHPAVVRPKAAWIECGLFDEYRLQPGARIAAELLRAGGVATEFREFEDGHMSVDYRFDTVLPWIVDRLRDL